MPPRCATTRAWLAITASLTLLLALPAAAQAPAAGVYRCGNQYSDSPCPGGKAVAADDARSAEQRQQAQAVKQRDATLADQLRAERQARELAAARQGAARIGPVVAQPAASSSADRHEGRKKERQKRPKKATNRSA